MTSSVTVTPAQAAVMYALASDAGCTWAVLFTPERVATLSVAEMQQIGVLHECGYLTGYKGVSCGSIRWDIYPSGDVTLHLILDRGDRKQQAIYVAIKAQKLIGFKMVKRCKESHCKELAKVLGVLGFQAKDITADSDQTVTITFGLLLQIAREMLPLPLQVGDI